VFCMPSAPVVQQGFMTSTFTWWPNVHPAVVRLTGNGGRNSG
jgi:hypothetical protein